MKLGLMTKFLVVIVLAVALFGVTSLIDRHGPALSDSQLERVAPYRHAKGVPLMYLQRSVPDGVWQTDERLGNGHYFNDFNLVFDAVFWLLIANGTVLIYSRLNTRR